MSLFIAIKHAVQMHPRFYYGLSFSLEILHFTVFSWLFFSLCVVESWVFLLFRCLGVFHRNEEAETLSWSEELSACPLFSGLFTLTTPLLWSAQRGLVCHYVTVWCFLDEMFFKVFSSPQPHFPGSNSWLNERVHAASPVSVRTLLQIVCSLFNAFLSLSDVHFQVYAIPPSPSVHACSPGFHGWHHLYHLLS